MTAVRSPFAGALAPLCLAGPTVPAVSTSAAMPLVSHHEVGDHRWFVWLPRHPV